MKKHLFLKSLLIAIGLLVTSVSQVWAAQTYNYAGDKSSWSNATMTVSDDGFYEWYAVTATSGNHEFKIRPNDDDKDWTKALTYTSSQPGFNYTDFSSSGDKGMSPSDDSWSTGGNIKIYTKDAIDYYILVYYANTTVNATSSPIVCASTSLPNNTPISVYYLNTSDWGTVNAYGWYYQNSTDGASNGWPGAAMTNTGRTYNSHAIMSYTYPQLYDKAIFNDGSSQTADIPLGSAANGLMYDGSNWVVLPPTVSGEWRYFPGQTISLTATASVYAGRTCSYQWQKHNGSSYTNIAGATSATLSIPNCTTADVGKYRCKVTYTSPAETTYSCGDDDDGFGVKIYTLIGTYKEDDDWTPHDITPTGGYTGTVELTLDKNKEYLFQLKEHKDNYWYGHGDYVCVQTWEATTFTKDGGNCRLFTGPKGKYTFTVNIENVGSNAPTIAVSYPEVAHPNDAYVYINKWWDHLYVHWWYTDGEGDHTLTTWGSDPELTTYTEICETNYYYFPIVDGYPKFIAKDAAGDPSNTTGDQTTASNGGKYITHNGVSWGWQSYNVHTITFAGNSNTGGSMTNVYPVCNNTNQTLAANGFTRTGYSFANWTADVNVKIGGETVTAGSAIANQATIQNITGDITLTAQWTPVELTFATEGNWNDENNWSPKCVPTIGHDVVIEKPVTVNINNARAKSVVIYNNGSTKTGQLNIGAAKELVIAETLKKTTNGSTYTATGENDLIIGSSSSGNGALIVGEYDKANQATVAFYSISTGAADDDTSVNQYVGIPFTNGSVLGCFYDSWVYEMNYSANPIAWKRTEGSLSPFTGYNIIYNGSAGHTYWMDGTLVPTSDKTCSGLHYDSGTGAANWNNENLLANSWTAPIKIRAMQASDFTNADATIYIFNSGSPDDYNAESKTGSGAAQYSTYPVASAAASAVIPSMQSFSVFTTAGSGSLVLDYSKIVYDPAIDDAITPAPNRAPKRTVEVEEMDKVRIYVEGESGYRDMIYMLEDAEQFTEGFDNGWDGRKLFGLDVAPQFYALSTDGNMAVAAVPDLDGAVLGFKAGNKDSQYTISFDYAGTNDLYLYDIDSKQETLVTNENTYVFTTSDEVAHNRFVLSKVPKMPTNVENTSSEKKAVKFIENGELYILRDGKLYNVMGVAVK